MKIAVPTNDGSSISDHFGRSAGFLIFEVENGQIQSRTLRQNGQRHTHEIGSCGHSHGAHGEHSHAGILAAVEGCETVICVGMGQRAVQALQSGGVTQIVVTAPGAAEEAVGDYLAGKLRPQAGGFCRCDH